MPNSQNILAIDSGYKNVGVSVATPDKKILYVSIIEKGKIDIASILSIKNIVTNIYDKYNVGTVIIEDYKAGIDNLEHTYWHIANIWSIVGQFEADEVILANVNVWQKMLSNKHKLKVINKQIIKALCLQYFTFDNGIVFDRKRRYLDSDAAGMIIWYLETSRRDSQLRV